MNMTASDSSDRVFASLQVIEVTEATTQAHERLMKTLLNVSARADELARTAHELSTTQERHTEHLRAHRQRVSEDLMEQEKHVCSIADSHRRDIDKVCRDAACARTMDALINYIEFDHAQARVAAYQDKTSVALDARVNRFSSQVRDDLIPKVVQKGVQDAVDLKVLPLEYDIKKIQKIMDQDSEKRDAAARAVEAKLEQTRVVSSLFLLEFLFLKKV